MEGWIYANSVALAMAIISGIVWVSNQNAERKSDNGMVKQDLENHKRNHEKLETRLTEHEGRIDKKLESLSEKMDDLKDLIIERTENR